MIYRLRCQVSSLFGIFLVAAAPLLAQTSASSAVLWTERTETRTAGVSNVVAPELAGRRTFLLNRGAMAAVLSRAPLESRSGSAPVEIPVPMPDGAMALFALRESPVLSPELSARHPEIRTYSGAGVDDLSLQARFDLTPAGFHGLILAPEGMVAIDPVDRRGSAMHTSSYMSRSKAGVSCSVTATSEPSLRMSSLRGPASVETIPTPLTQERIYRLAVSATAEYSARSGNTQDSVTASITSVINRTNAVYERDLGIRFRLVGFAIFTDATSPFTDTDQRSALTINQQLLDQRIGAANYDIGHVFLSRAGGGLGTFEALCDNSSKAMGSSPLGDYTEADFATEMVAHEIGHQLNARHTFNAGGSPGCNEAQRDTSSNYEVASGVTIMSYAGICEGGADPQDLDVKANGFFHTANIRQMLDAIAARKGCEAPPAGTAINSAPRIQAASAVTIPASTPFALSAVVTDPDAADQKSLTYSWEELDIGLSASPPYNDDGTRPLVRNYDPATSSTRYIPSLQYILANQNVPPTTYQKTVTVGGRR